MPKVGIKWKLTLKVLPFVVVILIIKLIAHQFKLEFLTLNSLFSAIISANVFLIGFLISGVLVDYKEAEKLPGEIAVGLEALTDEISIIYKNKKAKVASAALDHISALSQNILDWFYKKERTQHVQDQITALNDYFLAFEPLTQANFIVRMKQEQNNLRRIITRIHTIRETSFNPSGYAIAEIITGLLCFGLIFTRIDPYYESLFFVAFVSFILIYMVMLITDLDNPFGYYKEENLSADVSLQPIKEVIARIKQKWNFYYFSLLLQYLVENTDKKLVYLDEFSLLGSNYYWYKHEILGISTPEVINAGLTDGRVKIHQDLVLPLQRVDQDLIALGYRLYIKEGFRPLKLYDLVYCRYVQKYGLESADRLFNMVDKPHSSGKSVDIALVNASNLEEPVYLRDGRHGIEALFSGYYRNKTDAVSQKYQQLQDLIKFIMTKSGFSLGTKNEYFHFDFVG